ncbi:MAG: hypothetical protein AMXMBFR46_18120 [Acidimicrobiia bacterium]
MATGEPRGGAFHNDLERLTAVSVPSDGISLPLGPTTRWLGWWAIAAPLLLVLHVWFGHVLLRITWVARWEIPRRVIEASLFPDSRVLITVLAALLLASALVFAIVTEGFRLAGPRLQRLVLGTGAAGAVAAVAPASAVVTIALVTALYVVVAAVVMALVLCLIAAFFNS